MSFLCALLWQTWSTASLQAAIRYITLDSKVCKLPGGKKKNFENNPSWFKSKDNAPALKAFALAVPSS